jgi:GxxExxY protein
MLWEYQDLTRKIIAAAIEVHRHLGPGLLEVAYQTCLAAEFDNMGIKYQKEMPVPLTYKGKTLDCSFRIDFLIEETIILELKSTGEVLPVHESQLLSYLRFMNKQVGLILNFNKFTMKEGIHRFVLGAREPASP